VALRAVVALAAARWHCASEKRLEMR